MYLKVTPDYTKLAMTRQWDRPCAGFSVYTPTKFIRRCCTVSWFFDREYNSIIDLYSYGHDIESSWLMDWGCDLLGDHTLSMAVHALNSDLAHSVYDQAYRDHSLLNECERGVDDTTRVWWVQAEAVLGFVNEYTKSGEEKYAAAAADIWHYIEDKLVDKRPGGEWFWSVNAEGVPASRQPIVEPWKCPYHNGRMCMELIRRNPDVEV